MARPRPSLAVLPKGTQATARVALPFGPAADDVIQKLEGYKRRTKDGFAFTDSPHNLRLMQLHFPQLPIDRPPDFTKSNSRLDVPIGTYLGPFNKPLYKHQINAFLKIRDLDYWALFKEQGTGKTRVAIEKIGYHFARGELTGVIVVTFKGLHRQWVDQQLPEHMGTLDNQPVKYNAIYWDAKKDVLFPYVNPLDKATMLEILTINFEALNGVKGQEAVSTFAWRHHGALLVIIDESHAIKQYDTKRAEACCELAKLARFRGIMTGTPIPKKLEDEWSQSMFLNEDIFGFRYVTTFRSIYVGRDGEDIRIDQFRDTIDPYSFRITKDEALDLPPKIYEPYRFDLSAQARRAYNELRRNFLTELDPELVKKFIDQDSENEEVPDDLTFTVKNAAVLLLRLQQICSGRIVNEDGTTVKISDDRELALKDLLLKYEEQSKIIIWTRFRDDVKDVINIVNKFGEHVLLVGNMKDEDRWKSAKTFMEGNKCKFLISNPAVGGTGWNFQGECRTNIYYSNSYNSVHRWQSEDRTHRIGAHHPVEYIDLIANNTVDEGVLLNLQRKKDFASLVLDVVRDLKK